MGCDIHLYVEKYDNDCWNIVSNTNPYISFYEDLAKNALEKGDIDREKYMKERIESLKSKEPIVYEGWLYNGRNYSLFSILADVRNDYEIIPIDYPRGLPDNLSNELAVEKEIWEGDGHSYSYFTFKEILDYDWENQYLEKEAYVTEEVYKQFKNNGDPYPCCGGVGGGNVEIVLNKEMNRIINNKYPWEKDKVFYTSIKWHEKYCNIAEEFLKNINKYINENDIRDLNNYRIVFWFDN